MSDTYVIQILGLFLFLFRKSFKISFSLLIDDTLEKLEVTINKIDLFIH